LQFPGGGCCSADKPPLPPHHQPHGSH
jgi:hypothetical protein